MELFDKDKNLEKFMKRQEKILKENQIYSRLMFLPVIVIVASVLVLTYNFTAGIKLQEKTEKVVDAEEIVLIENDDIENIGSGAMLEAEKINLNTATLSELDELPGIGESKAKSIIDAREKMGGFRTVDDVLNAKGIGEKLLEQIRQYVFVE